MSASPPALRLEGLQPEGRGCVPRTALHFTCTNIPYCLLQGAPRELDSTYISIYICIFFKVILLPLVFNYSIDIFNKK